MRQLVLKNVLAATDLTPGAGDAVRTAAALAALAGARLHVVHASRDDPDAEGTLREHVRRSAPRAAEDAVLMAPAGIAHEVILHAAERAEADVIVLGPHRRGGSGAALGSTADRVVRGAGVPCLVVARPLELPLDRVVAALEPSDSGRGALLVALTWASALRRPGSARTEGQPGTRIDALHVVRGGPPRPDLTSLGEYVATVRGTSGAVAGVEIESVVRDGGASSAEVARRILQHAAEHHANLLVTGTRDRDAPEGLVLGSVSSAVVQDARIPVLLVPPSVWRPAVEEPGLPRTG